MATRSIPAAVNGTRIANGLPGSANGAVIGPDPDPAKVHFVNVKDQSFPETYQGQTHTVTLDGERWTDSEVLTVDKTLKILSDRRIKAGGSARVRYDIPTAGAKGPIVIQAHALYRQSKPQTLEAYGLSEEQYGKERSLVETVLKVP